MEQEAVAPKTGNVATDRGVGDIEDPGDLAQGGSFADHAGNARIEIAAPEPVGCGERAGGELPATVETLEGLEAALIGGPNEEASALETPVGTRLVEGAVWIRAVRRLEAAATPRTGVWGIGHTR